MLAFGLLLLSFDPGPSLPSRPSEPGDGDRSDRVFVELRPGVGRLYPPQDAEPRAHFQWGAAVSGVIHGQSSRFKAMIGGYGEHVVGGWAGEPPSTAIVPNPVVSGRYANTVPDTYRGQFFRLGAQARFGAENEFAFGFIRFAPGYALRVAPLRCGVGSCDLTRTTDHGLQLSIGFGAIFRPWRGLGVGVDLGLDSSFFPHGHGRLATWNNGFAGVAVVGWHW